MREHRVLRRASKDADKGVCGRSFETPRKRAAPQDDEYLLDDDDMPDLIRIFSERGDLAHLALFLWAAAASFALWFALRELGAASRRFDDFVRELARFNRRAHRRAKLHD
jgi:hypothetical protein